jgi:hypothetical protein
MSSRRRRTAAQGEPAPGTGPPRPSSGGDRPVRSRWARLAGPSLSTLLVFQIIYLFIVAPMVSSGYLPRISVEVWMLLIAVVSLGAAPGGHLERGLIVGALIVSMLAQGGSIATGDHVALRRIAIGTSGLFTLIITIAIARAVFREHTRIHWRIQGALVVYLNLALLFVAAYALLVTVVPTAFRNLPGGTSRFDAMLYLSLGTLTTSGTGDIVPTHPVARAIVNLEAVVGQVFLAIVLAQLVSLYAREKEDRRGA